MTVHRLREWPRMLAGGVLLAVVLVGIGLLIGAEALGTTTTTTTTVRTVAASHRTSPAQAAALAADRVEISHLRTALTASRRRLATATRALRSARRGTHHTTSSHGGAPRHLTSHQRTTRR